MTFTYDGDIYRLYFHHVHFDDTCRTCDLPPHFSVHYDESRNGFHPYEVKLNSTPDSVRASFALRGLKPPKAMTTAVLVELRRPNDEPHWEDEVAQATTYCSSVDQYKREEGRARALRKLLQAPAFKPKQGGDWKLGAATKSAYKNRERRGPAWRAAILEKAVEAVLIGQDDVSPIEVLKVALNKVRKARGLATVTEVPPV